MGGNLGLIFVSGGLGQGFGLAFLVYNLGWLVIPSALKHWSYTVGYVVGVIGGIALTIVIVLYSCSSGYGGRNG